MTRNTPGPRVVQDLRLCLSFGSLPWTRDRGLGSLGSPSRPFKDTGPMFAMKVAMRLKLSHFVFGCYETSESLVPRLRDQSRLGDGLLLSYLDD